VHVALGSLERLGELVPGGEVVLVTEPRVAGIHGAAAQLALGVPQSFGSPRSAT
jgi:hypothetical protein